MDVPEEERRDAERTGMVVHKKLLEIILAQLKAIGDKPTKE